MLRTVDLRVDQLDLMGSPFADTHVRLARGQDRTRVTLDGPEIAGNIVVPFADGAAVEGRLERLYWPEKALVDADGGEAPEEAEAAGAAVAALETGTAGEPAQEARQDPGTLPPLDFQVRDLRMGTLVLGEAQLRAHPVPGGLRIDTFSTRSEGYQLDAQGDWLRSGVAGFRVLQPQRVPATLWRSLIAGCIAEWLSISAHFAFSMSLPLCQFMDRWRGPCKF